LITKLAKITNEVGGDATLLRSLAPYAWVSFENFPEDILNQVRNRRLFRLYLKGIIGEMFVLLDMAWI
jgi:hypothetical protein